MIEVWNNPTAIYLLIPIMMGMLLYVRHEMWQNLRSLCIYKAFSQDSKNVQTRPFQLRCLAAEFIAFCISTMTLILLPKDYLLSAFLGVLILDIVLVFIVFLYEKYVFKRFIRIPDEIDRNLENISGHSVIQKHTIRPFLLGASFILLILAWMEPLGNENSEILKRMPMHVTVLFDLSHSMDATDISPSRIDAAKDEVISILRRNRDSEFALVFFTDTTFIQSPHTRDLASLKSYLQQAKTSDMPSGGTDISYALSRILPMFSSYNDQFYQDNLSALRRLIIVTDGETHGGELSEILKIYQDKKIPIDVLAFGTQKGSTIPDKFGNELKYEGETVISQLNRDGLQKMAKQTGGLYLAYTQPELMAENITHSWNQIREQAESDNALVKTANNVPYYRVFLYPAFGFMVLFMIYPVFVRVIMPFRRRRSQIKAQAYRTEISSLEP